MFYLIFSVLLAIVSACTAIGAFNWLSDPDTSVVSFTQSLWNHLFFTLAALILGMVTENLDLKYLELVYKLNMLGI